MTIAALFALDAGDPYGRLYRAMAPPESSDVPQQKVAFDQATFDVAFGANLLATHQTRVEPPPDTKLIVVAGNSQQFTCTLKRGSAPNDGEVKVSSDVFAAHLRKRSAHPPVVYNASAPNQNFVEQLWQAVYWFRVAKHRPDAWVIASNFDTYRKAGLRHGYQTLLDDPAFDAALTAFAPAGKPYSDEIAAARQAFAEQKAAGLAPDAKDETLEGRVRSVLTHFEPYARRQERKGGLVNLLYGMRVLFAGIKPTSKRHITGQPLAANWAALRDIIKLARGSGARVIIYNGPVNPHVSMFYPDEYDAYLKGLRELAAEYSCPFADFGSAIPPEHWGELLDGPDPIHFDETAHKTIGRLLDEHFGADLIASLAP